MIVHSAAQLVTCAADAPKRGAALRAVGLIPDGAVVIDGERIAAVGTTADLLARFPDDPDRIDASGKVVCPGFVDAHTHLVYAGDRIDEFEQRLGGATYMDIMAAGGGIASTMRATRAASTADLIALGRARLDTLLRLGTTTVEIKTGYGLDVETELKLLAVIAALAHTSTLDIAPTLLGVHAVPPEYAGRADAYVDLVVERLIPAAAAWSATHPLAAPLAVDVFCEAGVFTVEQSRRVWEAGRRHGMALKAHVDEFVALGGTTAAIATGAISVDHLDVTGADEIAALAASDTIGVILPAVNFHLGSQHYANARGMIDAGAAIALATDLNPGSAPCPSLPLIMAIACRCQRLLPAEALNAVTINAAYAIGMGDRVGSLAPGKQADLLIVAASDYRHLMADFGVNIIDQVIKRGRRVV